MPQHFLPFRGFGLGRAVVPLEYHLDKAQRRRFAVAFFQQCDRGREARHQIFGGSLGFRAGKKRSDDRLVMHHRPEKLWPLKRCLDADLTAIGPGHKIDGPGIESFDDLNQVGNMGIDRKTLTVIRPVGLAEIPHVVGHGASVHGDRSANWIPGPMIRNRPVNEEHDGAVAVRNGLERRIRACAAAERNQNGDGDIKCCRLHNDLP